MLPMIALRQALGTLLAADATYLAPATNANKIALIGAPFTLSENLTVGALTLLSANGLGPILGAVGAQEVALDPVTQAQIITLVPGAGSGWRWVSSGTFTGPITVYGFALCDNALANLWAAASLPQPIVINAAGYQVDLDPVQITFVLAPMF